MRIIINNLAEGKTMYPVTPCKCNTCGWSGTDDDCELDYDEDLVCPTCSGTDIEPTI